MALVNSFDGNGLWVAGDRRVLSPEAFGALQTAEQMLSECRAHCAAQHEQGVQRMREQEQLGYQHGQAQAALEGAKRLLEFERNHTQRMAAQQCELADLVLVVLERLAPSLAPGELIRSLARQAVEHARHASRAVLKVHPECVDDVALELDALRRVCAWLDAVEVVGVDGMPRDECLLESPHGFVSVSWPSQLNAIRALLDELGDAPPAAPDDDRHGSAAARHAAPAPPVDGATAAHR